MPLKSSGETASATVSAAAVDVIAAPVPVSAKSFRIVNRGAAGWFSLDGGNNWSWLNGATTLVLDNVSPIKSISIKREGATDMSGVTADVW